MYNRVCMGIGTVEFPSLPWAHGNQIASTNGNETRMGMAQMGKEKFIIK